jgi:hypothetical protein
MKKTFIITTAIAFSSIALAQNAVSAGNAGAAGNINNGGTGTVDSTSQHPAANKKSDTTVPSRDSIYSNSDRQRASDELNKKQIQGRNSNGVIDQGAPGGTGQPENKGQNNQTTPRTE